MTATADLELDTRWMAGAACTPDDTDLFFPPTGAPASGVRDAKAICATCPVQTACLDYIMATEGGHRFGVWGGKDPKERRALAAQRRQQQWRESAP